ncbi:hypothetical protein LSAT2_027801 [Lamellibrachia satsuma]|nr:hypothetical protein LSAT2_027801 [Lamellibrachia satsuma]
MTGRCISAPAGKRGVVTFRSNSHMAFVGEDHTRWRRHVVQPTATEDDPVNDRLSRTTYSLSAKAYPSLPPASPRTHRPPVPNHLPAFRRVPRIYVDEIITRLTSASTETWRRMHALTPRGERLGGPGTGAAVKQRHDVTPRPRKSEWIFY